MAIENNRLKRHFGTICIILDKELDIHRNKRSSHGHKLLTLFLCFSFIVVLSRMI